MQTLLLDTVAWDLVTDASNDIAVASDPYASAQDAASACRLFLGELWYNTTKGVPYFQLILGLMPPIALMKAKFVAAALTVPGVKAARCFISSFTNRTISGQVQITDQNGFTGTAAF